MHGGDRIAEVLKAQGVPFLFTLCGGHISPILVAAKARGIRVVDTRHEATAVFAADAVARLTGTPGVAAVTAGPGVTNTITAVKNAQMAQSPVVLLGGAAPTALKGRGALQDIDQLSLFQSIVKWSKAVTRVRDLAPAVETAFRKAREGVPGPVFVECPVDLLYDEALVRGWYGASKSSGSLSGKALNAYLKWHADRLFAGSEKTPPPEPVVVTPPVPNAGKVAKIAAALRKAERPVFIVGSQATLDAPGVKAVAAAVERIGAPVYLSGMARGLLGKRHPLHMRHKRRMALKEADFVLLAGVPCDFRLDYGNHIRRSAFLASANRSRTDLNKNRRPSLGVPGDPGLFLRRLAAHFPEGERWRSWRDALRARDDARDAEIREQAAHPTGRINPLRLCMTLEDTLDDRALLIGDGGDFVATASYITRPPGPLTWLDPGAFGTLGVGAGFALGAKLCRPDAEVWVLFGDGALGYSLAEFDTFVRHDLPVLALVGNDAGWSQIAREQVDVLKDDVATVLAPTDYHRVAAGFGAQGYLLDREDAIAATLADARTAAAAGRPVLVNALIGRTDFRKGSISM
jgi:acetolactate synthase-1/2/3 large subunit